MEEEVKKYLSLIKTSKYDNWKIGYQITNDLETHEKFQKELMECQGVKVKIFEVKEIK